MSLPTSLGRDKSSKGGSISCIFVDLPYRGISRGGVSNVSFAEFKEIDSHKADAESKRPKEDLPGAHRGGTQNIFDSHPDEPSFL